MSVAHIAFPRELLESTKLVKFERYAEFTVGRADRAQAPAAATGSWITAASTGRSTEMIYIDLPADLNLEDDEGRSIARLADAVTPDVVTRGAVLMAGTPHAWSWAVIEDVESGFVYFRQISARDAA